MCRLFYFCVFYDGSVSIYLNILPEALAAIIGRHVLGTLRVAGCKPTIKRIEIALGFMGGNFPCKGASS